MINLREPKQYSTLLNLIDKFAKYIIKDDVAVLHLMETEEDYKLKILFNRDVIDPIYLLELASPQDIDSKRFSVKLEDMNQIERFRCIMAAFLFYSDGKLVIGSVPAESLKKVDYMSLADKAVIFYIPRKNWGLKSK